MMMKYTWAPPNMKCLSRWDRVLLSANWLEEWGAVSLWGLKHDISDHCPLVVRYSNHDWGLSHLGSITIG
jgi:hypothetical protein